MALHNRFIIFKNSPFCTSSAKVPTAEKSSTISVIVFKPILKLLQRYRSVLTISKSRHKIQNLNKERIQGDA